MTTPDAPCAQIACDMDELAFLDLIQQHLRCGWLDAIMAPLTMLGNAGAVWLVLGVVLAVSYTHLTLPTT